MQIRLATLSDIDNILRIERASFGVRAFSRRQFSHYIKNGLIHVVADIPGVIGYIVVFVRANSDTARINVIAVDPSHTGKGYGTMLLGYTEQRCLADYSAISLEVNVINYKAIQLYKTLGYEATRVLCDYYGPGETALKMVKRLK